jgi:hypothetical protein
MKFQKIISILLVTIINTTCQAQNLNKEIMNFSLENNYFLDYEASFMSKERKLSENQKDQIFSKVSNANLNSSYKVNTNKL